MLFFLFLVAAVGGALNAVAGGGSFLTLPSLLYAGVTPVAANATSTLAMWPGAVASTIAYRRELGATTNWVVLLMVVSLVGGLIGAVLLVRTSDTSFMRLLPWLMLLAATTFTFGGHVPRPSSRRAGRGAVALAALLQFSVALYGGYFGGGMGIMMLAAFSVAGMADIHEMNALKSLLGTAINGLALLEFVVTSTVAWRPGAIMIVGSVLGGYLGAALARRLDPRWVRGFVMAIGWTMTIYFFVRS